MNKDKQAIYDNYMDVFKALFTQYDTGRAKELMTFLFKNTDIDNNRILIEGMGLEAELKETLTNKEVKGV